MAPRIWRDGEVDIFDPFQVSTGNAAKEAAVALRLLVISTQEDGFSWRIMEQGRVLARSTITYTDSDAASSAASKVANSIPMLFDEEDD